MLLNKKIALTFDDGPADCMSALLDCLEEHGAAATFFAEGLKTMEKPELIKRAVKIGCEVGNHSFAHENLTELPLNEALSSVAKTSRLLSLLTDRPLLLRPPYGLITPQLAAEVNMPVVLWSVDTLDWKTKDEEQTFNAIMENAADGNIILAHTNLPSTVRAAVRAVPLLLQGGAELVTVSEMLKYKYNGAENGAVYR